MLYRVTYIRAGLPRGVTFAAEDFVDALEFAELWEDITKCPVLTVKPSVRQPEAPPANRRLDTPVALMPDLGWSWERGEV